MIESMATLRVTEDELIRDVHAVLAKGQEGVEVIVEMDHRPVATKPRGKTAEDRVTIEAMATIHMSEAEVARDLSAVLAKVQQGVEVVIEKDRRPLAVIKRPPPVGRHVNECIARARAYEARLGFAPVPDADFASDVQEGVDARRDPIHNVWDE